LGGALDEVLATRTKDSPPVLLSDEEAARYRHFAATRHAVRIAQADARPGSRFTSADLVQGTLLCQQNAAKAAALWPQLMEAHELWREHIERTGTWKSPAGDLVQSLSQQVEDFAFDGGDLNTFVRALAWRVTKNDIAKSARQKQEDAAPGGALRSRTHELMKQREDKLSTPRDP